MKIKHRILAFFIVLVITYLSNIPNLKVLDIHTWFNPIHYEKVTLADVFKKGSVFYTPWEGHHESLDFYLHKLGHFLFYGFLSFFLFWKSSNQKRIFLKFILISGFALLDEIHQFFVVGRSGRLMDVCFDIICAIVFFVIIILTGNLNRKTVDKLEIQQNNQCL
jgi:VanZ family protein